MRRPTLAGSAIRAGALALALAALSAAAAAPAAAQPRAAQGAALPPELAAALGPGVSLDLLAAARVDYGSWDYAGGRRFAVERAGLGPGAESDEYDVASSFEGAPGDLLYVEAGPAVLLDDRGGEAVLDAGDQAFLAAPDVGAYRIRNDSAGCVSWLRLKMDEALKPTMALESPAAGPALGEEPPAPPAARGVAAQEPAPEPEPGAGCPHPGPVLGQGASHAPFPPPPAFVFMGRLTFGPETAVVGGFSGPVGLRVESGTLGVSFVNQGAEAGGDVGPLDRLELGLAPDGWVAFDPGAVVFANAGPEGAEVFVAGVVAAGA